METLSPTSRVVVTGYKGFIGSHLHCALAKLGVSPIAYDKKFGPRGDIRTADFVDADWCFHLAAETDAQSTDHQAMYDTNVGGTHRLLEKYGKRLIFASTCAVNYPGTPYADSKSFAEDLCRAHGARVLRLCNIFGPGGHGVIDNFARDPVLHIRGDGMQKRTYAHVNDAVAALLAMTTDPPGTLRLLAGADMTVTEIVDAFFFYKQCTFVPRSENDITNGIQIYD